MSIVRFAEYEIPDRRSRLGRQLAFSLEKILPCRTEITAVLGDSLEGEVSGIAADLGRAAVGIGGR